MRIKKRHSFTIIGILCLGLIGVSCSEAELTPFVPIELSIGINSKFELSGKTCSDPADVVTSRDRFIFVIDNSQSNEAISLGTDPIQIPCPDTANPSQAQCNQRYTVATDFISSFFDPQEGYPPEKEAIVVEFNDKITVCGSGGPSGAIQSGQGQPLDIGNQVGFAPLGEVFNCLIPNKQGVFWTEMGHAALAVQDLIENEIASMTPLEALATSFFVFLMQDGVPDDGVGFPQVPPLSFWENWQNVSFVYDEIYNDYNDLVRRMEFYVLQYGFTVLPPTLQPIATSLGLAITANDTRGEYLPIANISSINLIDFLSQEFAIKNNLNSFLVTQKSGRVRMNDGVPEFQPDTDGDGLTDKEESLQIGTDLFSNDTDGDGIVDFDEVKLGKNPLVADSGNCAATNGLKDSDKDGVSDCAELLYGTDASRVDTDGDGIPDWLELVNGLNPLVDDADDDPDNDLIPNFIEVTEGTLVDVANDEAMDSFKMDYTVFSYEEGTRTCLDFTVKNITAGITAENPAGDVGTNVLQAFSKISVFNDPLSVVWRQAQTSMVFDGETKTPADGKLELSVDDFQ